MKETLLFKIATAQGDMEIRPPLPAVINNEEDSLAEFIHQEYAVIPCAWPHLNYASYHISAEPEPTPEVEPHTPTPRIEPIFVQYITLLDLNGLAGYWLDIAQCGAFANRETVNYCSYHEILLCEKCVLHHDFCLHDLKSIWTIVEAPIEKSTFFHYIQFQ